MFAAFSFAFARGQQKNPGAGGLRGVSAVGPNMFKLGARSGSATQRKGDTQGLAAGGEQDLEAAAGGATSHGAGQTGVQGAPRLVRAMSMAVGRAFSRARSLRLRPINGAEADDEEGGEGGGGGAQQLTRSNSLASSLTSDATTVAGMGAGPGGATTDGDLTGYTTEAEGGEKAERRAALRAFELEDALRRAGMLLAPGAATFGGGHMGLPPGPPIERTASVGVPAPMVALVTQLESRLQGWVQLPFLIFAG